MNPIESLPARQHLFGGPRHICWIAWIWGNNEWWKEVRWNSRKIEETKGWWNEIWWYLLWIFSISSNQQSWWGISTVNHPLTPTLCSLKYSQTCSSRFGCIPSFTARILTICCLRVSSSSLSPLQKQIEYSSCPLGLSEGRPQCSLDSVGEMDCLAAVQRETGLSE